MGDMKQKEQKEESDENALFFHFVRQHKPIIQENLNMWDAYKLTFVERPKKAALEMAENCWIERLNAEINKAKTCLPKFK